MERVLTICLICYYYFLTIFNLFEQYYIHYLLSMFKKLWCILTIYYLFLNYIITSFQLFIMLILANYYIFFTYMFTMF
jgi:hypothetical protein